MLVGFLVVELSERYSNKRRRVERLSSAWNQGSLAASDATCDHSDPHLASATEPRSRPRTQLTDKEVNAMRTLRDQGISVNALAHQFGVHRTTVWLKTR
ncbi:helix-turn-helix domain-containing protein [Leucobacter sp. W1478]|uniref:helix-turn-helix domain-containing protein n=1 Tax=Leucobacter sp. W1478 TaxID=3439065 RepID=UPI003F3A90B3